MFAVIRTPDPDRHYQYCVAAASRLTDNAFLSFRSWLHNDLCSYMRENLDKVEVVKSGWNDLCDSTSVLEVTSRNETTKLSS